MSSRALMYCIRDELYCCWGTGGSTTLRSPPEAGRHDQHQEHFRPGKRTSQQKHKISSRHAAMAPARAHHIAVPANQLQILAVSNASDGTNVAPTDLTKVMDDAYFLREIAHIWCADPTSTQNALPGLVPELSKLPDGYHGYAKNRANPKTSITANGKGFQTDRWIYGHPSGRTFVSSLAFYDHFKHLQEHGHTHGCPCVLCSGVNQAAARRAARNVQTSQAAPQNIAQPQQPPRYAPQSNGQPQQQPMGNAQQAGYGAGAPRQQDTILPIHPPAVSDGTGSACMYDGVIQNDNAILEKFGKHYAQVHNIAAAPNTAYQLTSLPAGYSGWSRRDAKNPSILRHWIAGHPSGKYFASMPEFFDHVNHLGAYGMAAAVNACPCCLCSKNSRSKGEGVRLGAAGLWQAHVGPAIPPASVAPTMPAGVTPQCAMPQPVFGGAMMPSTGMMQPQGMLPSQGPGAFQGSIPAQRHFTQGAAPFQGAPPPDDSMEPAAVDGLLAYINGSEPTQQNSEPLDEQTLIDDGTMEYSFHGDQYDEDGIAYQPAIDPSLTQTGVDGEWQRLIDGMQDPLEATAAPRDLTADADMQFLNALLSPGLSTNASGSRNVNSELEERAHFSTSRGGNQDAGGEPEWIAEQIAPGEQHGLPRATPTNCPNCPFQHRATLCAISR